MPDNAYYYYDHDTCTFREVEPSKKKWLGYAGSVVVVATLIAAIGIYVAFHTVQTPVELAQQDEIDALRNQLVQANDRVEEFAESVETLQEQDRELYRTLLNADPISEEAFQMGVGGSEDRSAERYSGATSDIMQQSSLTLERLERQISVQRQSYRQLSDLATRREGRIRQQPAMLPVAGRLTSGFGMRRHPIYRSSRMHSGVDFSVPTGTPIYATADGVVSFAGVSSGYGNIVRIDHPRANRRTDYAHLSRFAPGIREGVTVRRGQLIAYSGNTGLSTAPHLHYEVRRLSDEEPLNPITTFAPGVSAHEYQELLAAAQSEAGSLD